MDNAADGAGKAQYILAKVIATYSTTNRSKVEVHLPVEQKKTVPYLIEDKKPFTWS